MAKTEERPPGLRGRLKLPKPPTPSEAFDKLREGEIWKSVFRPGSVFRKGYKDTQRDRALATLLADGLLVEAAGTYRLP